MNWMHITLKVPLIVVFTLMKSLSSSLDDVVTMDGDVMLGGLFMIQTGEDCDRIHPLSVQVHQAVRWTIQQLEDQGFTPNFTLGLQAYKTCGKSERAVKHATDMLKTAGLGSKDIYGILGPDKSSEMEAVSRFLSSLETRDSLLQLGFSTTSAALSDTSTYTNLYRVIETDTVQVQVMVQLLKQMEWNYVAIGYENDLYGINGAIELRAAAEAEGICIPIFLEVGNISTIINLREELDIGQQSPVSGMIFFGGGTIVTSIVEYFDQHLKMNNFQLIASEALALDQMFLKDGANAVHDRAKGLLVPTPVYSPIDSFTIYWNDLFRNESSFRQEAAVNPWIRGYFESLTGCILTPSTDIADCWTNAPVKYTMDQQPLYVSYAVLATSILVNTLKNVHEHACPGTNGPCAALRTNGTVAMHREINKLNITPSAYLNGLFPMISSASFERGKLNSVGSELYQVYNFRKGVNGQFRFEKAGYYNGYLSLSLSHMRSYTKYGDSQGVIDGQCKDGSDCSECLADPSSKIVHIPGDFYVVGLVPIHNRHPIDEDPYSYIKYGSLRESISVDIAEALIHAVHKLNNKSGQFEYLLGDSTVGLILLDTSNNPLIVQDKVISLHKGQLQLGKGLNSSAIVDKIIGYAGPVASSISIPLSPTMKNLNQLFIAYGSTSSELSNREEHSTFMRTTSALDKQVQPMMMVAKELGADYIQVLYTDESYGQSGKDAVLEGAKRSDVCVAQSLAVKEGVSEDSFIGVVNELRRFTYARLVVVFARSHTCPALLTAINEELEYLGEFIFFGSGEGWATRLHTISGKLNLQGSLTMAQILPTDPDFVAYFETLSGTSGTNPWLRDYLEERGNCYYPGSFQRKSKVLCMDDQPSDVYETDTWVPYAANAVTSLVIGFNKTMTEVCKGTKTKCDSLTTDKLIQHVKMVQLDLFRDGTLQRVFDSDGNGASGFRISQIVQNQSTRELVYKNIGSWIGEKFVFEKSLLSSKVSYSSNCPTDYECKKCDLNPPAESSSDTRTPWVTAVAVEAVIILALTVIIIVVVLKFRKKKRQVPDDYLTPTFCSCGQCYAVVKKESTDTDYIYAVYHSACHSQTSDAVTNVDSQSGEGITLENRSDLSLE